VLLAQHPEAEPRDEPPSQWPVFAAEVERVLRDGALFLTPIQGATAPQYERENASMESGEVPSRAGAWGAGL